MVFVAGPVPATVLRPSALALLAVCAVLAGCSGQPGPGTGDVAGPDGGMTIVGLVQNETFVPVAGAQVSLRLTNHTALTDAGGLFTFQVPLAPYLVDVAAAGFLNATLGADPQQNVSLSFILARPAPAVPEPVTTHFTGYFQCAFEALIIPGSCDFFLDGTGQDVFEDRNVFQTGLGPRWSTVVGDLDFDPQPGLDALRVTVRGRNDADQLAGYEQYGRFHDRQAFTFRLEPGQSYPDGDQPVPANATSLQFDVYPQGLGYHALCSDPVPDVLPPDSCPLGVAATANVSFDLYVTVFFAEPAPAGFTLLA